MALNHEEPCEIAHCTRFMDSLVSFLNEAGLCMYQVKTCLGMTPGCSAGIKMNEEEKVDKLNAILNALNNKCKQEVNKEDSHEGGGCPPSCNTSVRAITISSDGSSHAPGSMLTQTQSGYQTVPSLNFGGISTVNPSARSVRGESTVITPPTRPSRIPMNSSTQSSLEASRTPPPLPRIAVPSNPTTPVRRPVASPGQPGSPGLSESTFEEPSAHEKNIFSDQDNFTDEDGDCPGVTPKKKSRKNRDGQPKHTQECNPNCYGSEHTRLTGFTEDLSSIRGSSGRPQRRAAPQQTPQHSFGYASRLALSPSMSDRFSGNMTSIQSSNAGRPQPPPVRFNVQDLSSYYIERPRPVRAPEPPSITYDSRSSRQLNNATYRVPQASFRTPPGYGPPPDWVSSAHTAGSSAMNSTPSYQQCPPQCDETFISSVMASRTGSSSMGQSTVPRPRPPSRPQAGARPGGCGVGCRPITLS